MGMLKDVERQKVLKINEMWFFIIGIQRKEKEILALVLQHAATYGLVWFSSTDGFSWNRERIDQILITRIGNGGSRNSNKNGPLKLVEDINDR